MVLEAWRAFEDDSGTPDTVDKVTQRMPKKVKKRRLIDEDVGVCASSLSCTYFELYLPLQFPKPLAQALNSLKSLSAGRWVRGVFRLHIPRRTGRAGQCQTAANGTHVEAETGRATAAARPNRVCTSRVRIINRLERCLITPCFSILLSA